MSTYNIKLLDGSTIVAEPTIGTWYEASYSYTHRELAQYIGNDTFIDDMEGWKCSMKHMPFIYELICFTA